MDIGEPDSSHRRHIRCIAITDFIIAVISTCLGFAGIACIGEIVDLFGVKNEDLKLGAWILSLIINVLHLSAALSLLRGAAVKGDSSASSSIQYSSYWFSMSMFIIIMLSLQFFFSFRSSIPILMFYLIHMIFRTVAMLKLHSHIQQLETFTRTMRGENDNLFTTTLLKVPSMTMTTPTPTQTTMSMTMTTTMNSNDDNHLPTCLVDNKLANLSSPQHSISSLRQLCTGKNSISF